MLDRLKIRFPDIDEALANELITTATDRIKLRTGIKNDFPSELESIAVEVVSAMYNRHRMNHEGVDSESVDVFSVKFINNLLDHYDDELNGYKKMIDEDEDAAFNKVRFI